MAAGDVETNLDNLNARRCASFDNVDDRVSFGYRPGGFKTGMKGTISVWVYRIKNPSVLFKGVLTKSFGGGIGAVHLDLLYGDSGNSYTFYIGNQTNFDTFTIGAGVGTNKNEWHHFVITWDNTTLKAYVDGVFIKQQAQTRTFYNREDRNFALGYVFASTGVNYNWGGGISGLNVYDQALEQAEVTRLYQGDSTLAKPILSVPLAYDYKDVSGNGSHGTNYGSYLTSYDDATAKSVKADRTTANDLYLICPIYNKVLTTVIEEAP